MLEQAAAGGVLLIGLPIDAAVDFDARVGSPRLQRCQSLVHLVGVFERGDAQVDGSRAGLRNHVIGSATCNLTDVERNPAGVVGHAFDGNDLVRHLQNGAAAVGMPDAGMRGAAVGGDLIAADTLAGDDDLAAVARGFGDEHIFGAFGRRLDQDARGGAADFLVRCVEQANRQVLQSRIRGDGAIGGKRQIGATFHVADARAVSLVALDAEGQIGGQGAERMHGIEMAEHKNT